MLNRLPIITLFIALVGLFAAGVLSAGHFLAIPVPCGGSRGCLAVAMHPSSYFMGIPVAYIGFAAYCFIIALLFRLDLWRIRLILLLTTGFGTLISAYLLYYSQTVIRATCPWCVASGVAMFLLLVASLLFIRRREFRPTRPSVIVTLLLIALTLVLLQGAWMQYESIRPPISAKRLASLDPEDLTAGGNVLGKPDAPVAIIMFGDMWCPACRMIWGSLVQYQKDNPGGVRLVYRHLPLYMIAGHEYSGTAAALSEIAAEHGKFWDFLHHVHEKRRPLTPTDYLDLMKDLGIDPDPLEARLEDPEDPAILRVERDMILTEYLGIHETPTFVIVADGLPPASASIRRLPRVLNSPPIQRLLLEQKALARQAATQATQPATQPLSP